MEQMLTNDSLGKLINRELCYIKKKEEIKKINEDIQAQLTLIKTFISALKMLLKILFFTSTLLAHIPIVDQFFKAIKYISNGIFCLVDIFLDISNFKGISTTKNIFFGAASLVLFITSAAAGAHIIPIISIVSVSLVALDGIWELFNSIHELSKAKKALSNPELGRHTSDRNRNELELDYAKAQINVVSRTVDLAIKILVMVGAILHVTPAAPVSYILFTVAGGLGLLQSAAKHFSLYNKAYNLFTGKNVFASSPSETTIKGQDKTVTHQKAPAVNLSKANEVQQKAVTMRNNSEEFSFIKKTQNPLPHLHKLSLYAVTTKTAHISKMKIKDAPKASLYEAYGFEEPTTRSITARAA